ncbi:MAG: type II secretion system protein GspL [Legionellaceae bacterium]|nr:type II secretion system protein GspL [Legionellaceae bacterium]
MTTCFLFLESIEVNTVQREQLWAVRLDDAGEVDLPLASYTIEEIKSMQIGSQTVVVLPASIASLHRLDLPKLSSRKAREAIPYALEEELAEPVSELHVAFDRDTQGDSKYRVVVINRLRLRAWMLELEALELPFDAITLDWFAVQLGEVCATATDLLVHQDTIVGALSPLMATQYLTAHPEACAGFAFDDSEASLQQHDLLAAHEGSYRLFVAKRLLAGSYVNLCQGGFQHRTHDKTGSLWYGVCGALLVAWFVSVLGMNAIALHRLQIKQAGLDKQIAKHYHVFFPEAKQVISPRFRIERLLNQTGAAPHDSFWMLFDTLANVVALNPLDIESIRFRDQTLWVSVAAQDFALLEAFEQKLKNARVRVKKTQARTRDNQVTATLELRL